MAALKQWASNRYTFTWSKILRGSRSANIKLFEKPLRVPSRSAVHKGDIFAAGLYMQIRLLFDASTKCQRCGNKRGVIPNFRVTMCGPWVISTTCNFCWTSSYSRPDDRSEFNVDKMKHMKNADQPLGNLWLGTHESQRTEQLKYLNNNFESELNAKRKVDRNGFGKGRNYWQTAV